MRSDFQFGRPTIGVLAGWQFYRTATNLSYLAPVYRGITKAASDLGCNLLLGCGMGLSASPSDPFRTAWPMLLPGQDFVPISEWNTDGLIIAVPLHSQSNSDYVQNLRRLQHPILLIGSGEPGPTIAVDNWGGIQQAMQHLYQHGHREIAFIAGSEDDMRGDSGERLRAYHQFVQSHHLSADPRLLAFGQHIYSGGRQAMQKILDAGCQFTAVMASNDESALGAMDVLETRGYNIPQDVAIIGFDNRIEGAIQEPGLTSVHVPLYDIGYRSVKYLLQSIKESTPFTETIKVETQLVVRQSCGCTDGLPISESAPPVEILTSQSPEQDTADLVRSIAQIIMKEVQNFSEDEIVSFGTRLVNTYLASLKSANDTTFQQVLLEILERTESSGDVVYLWQKAIKRLEVGLEANSTTSSSLINQILSQARQTINSQMQQQYRRHVMQERWTTSRLSLMTAELLTALGKEEIITILARYLPEMNVHTAFLALFQLQEEDPIGRILIRDTLQPTREAFQCEHRNFPPNDLFDSQQPFSLTLIPIVDQESQLGFMAFGTDQLDLYGAVVQQISSAVNTIRLYDQAMEGRQLAEEANRMKSSFLSMISHELRTPLNLIVGLSDIVLKDIDEENTTIPSTTQKDIGNINAYAQYLNNLIGDVIDLATLDAGQLRLNKEFIDLGETLQLVVESGKQLAADKGLKFLSHIPDSGPWILGDRTRICQIVLNLINNAIKFTTQGEVILSLSQDDEIVTISVRDTGLGIPPQEQDRVFDAFKRTSRSESDGLPGLGLGLTICKMLTTMHNGTIELHSSGIEGEGSTFKVKLPVIKPPLAESPFSIDDSQIREQSILVLTSQPHTTPGVFNDLKDRGLTIQQAYLGDPGNWQAILGRISPDLIIIDVTNQSGLDWSALRTIKENDQTSDIPTLLYASAENKDSLLRFDYLTKPVDVADFTRALDQHWGSTILDHQTRTILVVDDDPNTLDLYARIVQSHSPINKVRLANNGEQALQILQTESIDLVLLDLQMPKMDGFSVLNAMRNEKSTSKIPVIIITGTSLTKEDIDRLNQGVSVILQKGLFSMSETIEHIESTLQNKQKLSNETQYLVRQAMAFIHNNYNKPLSREDIAQHVNISKDYLTYCFRQELKTTPIRYIQRYRINLAKPILKNSQKSITEIAMEVGFNDSGYFSRLFHREVGISPDQFRHS